MSAIQDRFAALMRHRAGAEPVPELTPAMAHKLIGRLNGLRLFAHGYALLTNLTHGRIKPADLLDFAWRRELQGLCLHVLDGEENSLSQMSATELTAFGGRARDLGLDLHVEISTTEKASVDQAVTIARAIGAKNIRVYARYEGRLSAVMDRIGADLRHLADLADRFDLNFDFEQHEELKSAEIAELLRRANHPRLNALFDFGNMINANERPLPALRAMAPYIRQVHLKGVRIVPQGKGTGHYGVLQGSAEDDMPGPRMFFELLMLGEGAPQVVAFALEQENHYAAPAFRQSDEDAEGSLPPRGSAPDQISPRSCSSNWRASVVSPFRSSLMPGSNVPDGRRAMIRILDKVVTPNVQHSQDRGDVKQVAADGAPRLRTPKRPGVIGKTMQFSRPVAGHPTKK